MLSLCLQYSLLLSVVLSTFLLGACSEEAQPTPPPPEVEIITVVVQPMPNIIELPGRLQAVRTAEVRARVDGIVQEILYEEGSQVHASQPLFTIDPREMRANLNAVLATLARAQANAANAQQDIDRYENLIAVQAISKQEYDAAVARLRVAQADVAQARAQVESAQLNLNYTSVNAPIAGRAGRAQVSEGAQVSAAGGTLLTTIEQADPIYVNFSQSSSDLLKVRSAITSGRLKMPELDRIPVRLTLEDGSTYGHVGHINFLALSIDVVSGTAALRAEVPNPDRFLLPGQFVRATIEAGVKADGTAVPQRAVKMTEAGGTVMVVGPKDIVEMRSVQLGEMQGGNWVVLGGLTAGDRVIVNGLQKAQPGQVVRITSPGSDTPSATSKPPPAH